MPQQRFVTFELLPKSALLTLSLSFSGTQRLDRSITITGSKSETNRILLLQALYPTIAIENGSNSDDGEVMQKGLGVVSGEVDIHHAGTAMRFLTAFFAAQKGKEVILTGSERMQQRPIGILVDALQHLGARITYAAKEGYPPLQIQGEELQGNEVKLPADISSQYISALCLIAPSLPKGLQIDLEGKITSVPYIKMTLGLLEQIGVTTTFKENRITILPLEEVSPKTLVVESDWSAAGYFYSIVALADLGSKIELSTYRETSLQGDSVLQEIYKGLGVSTQFLNGTILLEKTGAPQRDNLVLDLRDAPDIAQTLAVTCFGLGISGHFTGLHTLPIKETDRLTAMKTELEKFGAEVIIDHESLSLKASSSIEKGVSVATYNDHRMAMAFAPLALREELTILDAEVVSKSYPDFWKDLEKVGFEISEV